MCAVFAERMRVKKTSTKNGFDWIIMNLALAQNWIPARLPFIRTGPTETSRTKTETEFDVDFAFLSQAGRRLTIFVLKDEVLTYANWIAESLRRFCRWPRRRTWLSADWRTFAR